MKHSISVRQLTYMALMAALNVAFVILTAFVPLAGLFLSLALPLASALVATNADIRFYPIYGLATLGLCLIVTPAQLETTLFYILPSLILGLAFGLLFKRRWHPLVIIVVTGYVQLGLLYLTVGLINLIFQIYFVATLLTLLSIGSFANVGIIIPTLLYVVSLAQATLVYFIVGAELRKMTSIAPLTTLPLWVSMSAFLLNIAIMAFGWLLPTYGYLFLGPAFIIAFYHLSRFFETRDTPFLIASAVWLGAAVFLFALLFPLLDDANGLILIGIFPLGIHLAVFAKLCLPFLRHSHKMNSRG